MLFAKVTPCMENGKIAVAKNLKNGIGYGSSEFHVFRCSSQINVNFSLLSRTTVFSSGYNACNDRCCRPKKSTQKYLEDYKIALPPILEQMQIIEEIENRLSVWIISLST